MKRGWIFIGVLILSVAIKQPASVAAQDTSRNQKRPSVFLTFERYGGSPAIIAPSNGEAPRLSLRLHNNTHAPIAVDANGDFTPSTLNSIVLSDGSKALALPNGKEVELCYEAEAVPQKTAEEFAKILVPQQIPSAFSCKWSTGRNAPKVVVWIPSGSTVIFSLPAPFLGENLKVFTRFN